MRRPVISGADRPISSREVGQVGQVGHPKDFRHFLSRQVGQPMAPPAPSAPPPERSAVVRLELAVRDCPGFCPFYG
jgi:hypothetical protein